MNDLVGVWELKEYVVTSDAGTEVPWCSEPFGMLIYTASGHMSVAINCRGAPQAEAPSKPFNDRLLYAGTYTVTGASEVVHHIQNTSQLDQLGDSVTRTFELKGSRLVLSGKPFKGRRAFRIVWTRLPPS
jgi:hypothetical protein